MRTASSLIVDPSSGAVQHVPGASLSFETWRADPRRAPVDPPQFFLQDGRIVRWNFATNRPEPVVPKG